VSLEIRAHAGTHPGRVREKNEDTCDMVEERRFYAVYDGMGGHNAGEVASSTARQVIREYLEQNSTQPPDKLLRTALDRASKTIYLEARRRRELHGMGTTAVVCIVDSRLKAWIAHVGDSRAYLIREGKMQQLTRDHTVVSELLARGALSPAEARTHPYKSVLSRNLGGKPKADAEIAQLDLVAGDRLLLCSDGLTGFASLDAIEQVASGAEDPRSAVSDLIELALRGGGGDNVTSLVLEVGDPVLPEATQVVRTTGASGWWSRRDHFVAEAERLGVAGSPICAHLSPNEALELLAASLHEALYHDLEQTTGIHVWTYAENLSLGWLEQGGAYVHLRQLFDRLRAAAMAVVAELDSHGESHAVLLESAVQRALVVGEMAMAGVVAERIRRVESEIARRRPTTTTQVADEVTQQHTIPFLEAVRPEPASPQITSVLESAHELAVSELERAKHPQAQTRECLAFAGHSAIDYAGDQDLMPAARELVGARELSDAGFGPLLDSLTQARMLHFDALAAVDADAEVGAAAVRRVALAHHTLAIAVAFVTADSAQPVSDALGEAAAETARLRTEVDRGERRIAQLNRRVAGAETRTEEER
jgi:protein phosphatase